MNAVETPDVLAEIGDGSTVTDREALDSLVAQEVAELKKSVSGYRGYTTVAKKVARLRMNMRRLIVASSGHPDWAAGTDAYRLILSSAEAAIWAETTADEKRRVDGAIRQHVARTYLEPEIVDYVLSTVNGMPKVGDLKWTEGDAPVIAGDVPEVLKKAVAKEYKAANLTVPPKFGGPAKGGTGGGTPPGDPENPRAAFETAIGALENLAPLLAATDILRALTALSDKVLKDSEVSDREAVAAISLRCGVVGHMTAKSLQGKANEKDREALNAARWTKTDQQ